MSPDLYFVMSLILRMAITAAFVIAATVTAERMGPLIGGLVASLPVSAGPVYLFLSLDHDARFISESALASVVTSGTTVLFAVSYALLAQKRTFPVSLGGAFAIWGAANWLASYITWSAAGAIAFNVVALAIGLWLSSSFRHVQFPRMRIYWTDYAMRAAMVATLVGVVVALSHHIGPAVSGALAVFPVVFTSIIIILHRRVGGPATAAVLSNAIIGLAGFAAAAVALHLTAEPLGVARALLLALCISVGANVAVFMVRRQVKAT